MSGEAQGPLAQAWVEPVQQDPLTLIPSLPDSNPVFSSVCLVHCLSCNEDFWLFTVNGVSLAQAMKEWYFSNSPVSVVGQCTGWDCTLQCSGGPWEPTNQPCTTSTNAQAQFNSVSVTTSGSAAGTVATSEPALSASQQQQLSSLTTAAATASR